MPFDGAEKRQFKRVPVSFEVSYTVLSPLEAKMEFGHLPGKGRAQDLSEGGISFLTSYALAEETTIELRFAVEGRPPYFEERLVRSFIVQADVRYRAWKENIYKVGVRFLNLSDAERQFIAFYVAAVPSVGDF